MASRFAVLNPEVDLDDHLGKKKEEKPKVDNSSKKNNKNSKQKKKTDVEQLQNLAFGNPKSKSKKKNKNNNTNANNKENSMQNGSSVDEEWKMRDNEFVQNENERSLREAIYASKLDFEEKKEIYALNKKETSEEKSKGGKSKKKKDKPVTISLDQFNKLKPGQLEVLNGQSVCNERLDPPAAPTPSEDTFFDDVDEATRKTLEREKKHIDYQTTASQFSAEIKASEYETEIEKRDFEIQALRLEVEALKNELKQVKTRNKKLCEVISLSEMKSKGELVIELQKVNKARDEFSQEVTRLSAELEQEKTKVSQLQSEHRKSQGKKKHNTDSVSKE